MLTGKDIIVFSDDWGRHPSSCQHIIRCLLASNRILWVNTIGIRNPTLSLYDIKRSMEKIGKWVRRRQTESVLTTPNLTILEPFMIPYNNISCVRKLNCSSVINHVKQSMLQLEFKSPIMVTTVPNSCDYIGLFNEKCIVYYCVDDFTKWPGVNQKLITNMEEKLLTDADLVFATAMELCKSKSRKGKQPIYLSHGVDYQHFDRGSRQSRPLDGIEKPIIGFFGAISSWLDFQLIAKVAKERPEYSFVFIGPSDANTSLINNLTNVYLLGRVPYEQLPSYSWNFDVGIIPFLVNELTVKVNPVKLLEYMACGFPVVSTSLPEVKDFGGGVYIADNADEFILCVDKALSEDSLENRIRRKKLSMDYSWESVCERFCMTIEQYINS